MLIEMFESTRTILGVREHVLGNSYSIYSEIQEFLELDMVIKKVCRSKWWRVVIG